MAEVERHEGARKRRQHPRPEGEREERPVGGGQLDERADGGCLLGLLLQKLVDVLIDGLRLRHLGLDRVGTRGYPRRGARGRLALGLGKERLREGVGRRGGLRPAAHAPDLVHELFLESGEQEEERDALHCTEDKGGPEESEDIPQRDVGGVPRRLEPTDHGHAENLDSQD